MSDLRKVAHMVAGQSLVGWVLKAIEPLDPVSTVVVLGHGADLVEQLLPDSSKVAIQESQLGTGHAAKIGVNAIAELTTTFQPAKESPKKRPAASSQAGGLEKLS